MRERIVRKHATLPVHRREVRSTVAARYTTGTSPVSQDLSSRILIKDLQGRERLRQARSFVPYSEKYGLELAEASRGWFRPESHASHIDRRA